MFTTFRVCVVGDSSGVHCRRINLYF